MSEEDSDIKAAIELREAFVSQVAEFQAAAVPASSPGAPFAERMLPARPDMCFLRHAYPVAIMTYALDHPKRGRLLGGLTVGWSMVASRAPPVLSVAISPRRFSHNVLLQALYAYQHVRGHNAGSAAHLHSTGSASGPSSSTSSLDSLSSALASPDAASGEPLPGCVRFGFSTMDADARQLAAVFGSSTLSRVDDKFAKAGIFPAFADGYPDVPLVPSLSHSTLIWVPIHARVVGDHTVFMGRIVAAFKPSQAENDRMSGKPLLSYGVKMFSS
jgi:flavin reductase (DIM6/NTAB) family NADH-FMN oxidoreductase RutF